MAFPSTLEHLLSSGYMFLRSDVCSECGQSVEVFSTPGKREIAINPMCEMLRPVVRHIERCNIAPTEDKPDDRQANSRLGSAGAQPGNSATRPSSNTSRNSGSAGGDERVSKAGIEQIKFYGVNDPNRQLIAVGWEDGVLICQFKTAKYSYAGVPEAEFIKLRRSPFVYRIFTTNIKGKFPYTKVG